MVLGCLSTSCDIGRFLLSHTRLCQIDQQKLFKLWSYVADATCGTHLQVTKHID